MKKSFQRVQILLLYHSVPPFKESLRHNVLSPSIESIDENTMRGVFFCFLALGFSLMRFSSSSTSRARDAFWTALPGAVDNKRVIEFQVFVRFDAAALEDAFLRVSDPSSRFYAKYLTLEGVCDLVRPVEWRRSALQAFLAQHGLRVLDTGTCGDAWKVRATAAAIERAFAGTKLGVFAGKSDPNIRVLAAREGVAIPAALEDVIDVVHGLHFPVLMEKKKKQPKKNKGGRSDYADSTPPILRKLYGVPAPVSGGSNSSQAVAGWEHQSYNEGDLRRFQRAYSLPEVAIRHVYGKNTDLPHLEANLDTQWIDWIGGIPTDFYLSSGFSFDVLEWALLALSQNASAADVFSLSYGEDLALKSVAYAVRTDAAFRQLALRGKSVLVASGDTGAESRQVRPSSERVCICVCFVFILALGSRQLCSRVSGGAAFVHCCRRHGVERESDRDRMRVVRFRLVQRRRLLLALLLCQQQRTMAAGRHPTLSRPELSVAAAQRVAARGRRRGLSRRCGRRHQPSHLFLRPGH